MKIRFRNDLSGYAQYINHCMCRLWRQFRNFDTFFSNKIHFKAMASHWASKYSNIRTIVNVISLDQPVIGFVSFVKLDELDDMRYQRLSSVIAKMFCCKKLISVRLNWAICGFQSSALPLRNSNTALKFGTFTLFRWFKFTHKPPYSIAHDNLWLAIWDNSFWTFWLKFGHKGPWDIS